MIKVIKITKADFYRSPRLGSSDKKDTRSRSRNDPQVCLVQIFGQALTEVKTEICLSLIHNNNNTIINGTNQLY